MRASWSLLLTSLATTPSLCTADGYLPPSQAMTAPAWMTIAPEQMPTPIDLVAPDVIHIRDSDQASVSTVKADGNGLHKGDLVISMPGGLGSKVEEIIARGEHCPAPSSRKRDDLLNCVADNAGLLIGQAGAGTGPLGGLVIANAQLPGLSAALAAVLQTVIQKGRQYQGALADAQYTNLATMAFFLAYADIVLHENPNVASPTQFVMSATYLASQTVSSSTKPSSSCPPDKSTPDCTNCGGDDGSQHCKGIASSGGLWKGCSCFSPTKWAYQPFANDQDFLAAQSALANLPDGTGTAPAPPATSCTVRVTLVWIRTGAGDQNYDTMGFSVGGKYSGVSDPPTGQRVWDNNNADAATPKLGSKPGPLPSFLIATYDHDRDWVQFNYGDQAWASNDQIRCGRGKQDWGNVPPVNSFERRQITCNFDC